MSRDRSRLTGNTTENGGVYESLLVFFGLLSENAPTLSGLPIVSTSSDTELAKKARMNKRYVFNDRISHRRRFEVNSMRSERQNRKGRISDLPTEEYRRRILDDGLHGILLADL
jgi:hypothetical protein